MLLLQKQSLILKFYALNLQVIFIHLFSYYLLKTYCLSNIMLLSGVFLASQIYLKLLIEKFILKKKKTVRKTSVSECKNTRLWAFISAMPISPVWSSASLSLLATAFNFLDLIQLLRETANKNCCKVAWILKSAYHHD